MLINVEYLEKVAANVVKVNPAKIKELAASKKYKSVGEIKTALGLKPEDNIKLDFSEFRENLKKQTLSSSQQQPLQQSSQQLPKQTQQLQTQKNVQKEMSIQNKIKEFNAMVQKDKDHKTYLKEHPWENTELAKSVIGVAPNRAPYGKLQEGNPWEIPSR